MSYAFANLFYLLPSSPHFSITLGILVVDFFNQKVDGDFFLNPECYPNVTEMVRQARATTGANLMVSIWPDVKTGSASQAAMQVGAHAVGRWYAC
jgi:alpha-glucosidase (family GH31 glycosyl hydrolase)